MAIRIVDSKDKLQFNKVVGHPIQSWEWGEFREKTGVKVLRLGEFGGQNLVNAYQITIHTIPYINFKIGVLFKCPGPSVQMLRALRELGRKENLIFIRLEPNAKMDNKQSLSLRDGMLKLENTLREHGAVPGRRSFTKETFIIDLTKSEEELLKAMHPKTRYNIRVAQRHEVVVTEDNSKEAFEEYLRLTFETAKRQGFYAHTPNYHRLMWQALKSTGIARLLTAKYNDKILIAWIVFIWKDTLYYPYGASSDEDRNVMAAYAMMWEAIRFGKKLGLKKFDLWGKEEGKGFTRFKEGFAPQVVEFIGTWDLIINPILYWPYRLTEALRWVLLKAKAKILPTASL